MIPTVDVQPDEPTPPDIDLPPEAPAGEPATGTSRRIVVLSPKGGCGRTTVATNLALALERARPGSVGLVDLALAFGDVATGLLLDPSLGLGRLAEAPRPFSVDDLRAQLLTHRSGLRVLVAPDDVVRSEELTTDDVCNVFDVLPPELELVVVDTPAGLDANTLTAVERATDLVLVVALDVATLLGMRQALDALDRLGMAAPRHVVVNRGSLRTGLDAADVEATLGLPITATVPDDPAFAVAANEGHPLVLAAPRSPAARALDDLARHLLGAEVGRPARRRRRGVR